MAATRSAGAPWTLAVTPTAQETLDTMDRAERRRVDAKLTEVCEHPFRTPWDFDLAPLAGPRDGRLKIGQGLRAAVDVDAATQTLTVYSVTTRENAYS